jgi:glycosyltransferase involved in cell wall biosynthesis
MRLMREVIRQDPDLVLSADAPTEIQFPLCLLCSLRGIVFANWVQDFFSLAVKRLLSSKSRLVCLVIGDLYGAADRWIVRRSAVSIVISDKFASLIDSWRLPRVSHVTIPNWAPVEKFPAGSKNNSWGNRHDLASRFVFLYSGTLGLKHNPSLFLDLARHFEGDAGVEIVVVAEGAGAEWLTTQSALQKRPNLRVLPYQPAEELPEVLASADVLMAVLEKVAGDFSVPSKVLTYFCAQRAILLAVPLENLASRTVLDHQMGLVSEPDNPAGFIENARRLYDDAKLREGMGARARRYAEENFRIEMVADKFERALGLPSRAASP